MSYDIQIEYLDCIKLCIKAQDALFTDMLKLNNIQLITDRTEIFDQLLHAYALG